MSADSDPVPLDGKRELDEFERLQFRKWLRDQERVQWLGRQVRKWWPVLVALASGAVALVQGWSWLVQWAAKHAPKP